MARKKQSAGTPALLVVEAAGVPHRVHEHAAPDPHGHDLGGESARILGIAPERVLKTLVARAEGRLVVGVVPVSGHLDLKALAAAVGAKRAQMAEAADAERATGYVVGGISPLGQRTRLPMVIDESVMAHETVVVSGGKRGLKLELAPTDLLRLSGAAVAPISTT